MSRRCELAAWPRGRWPFKKSGRGRAASWLQCFCLSVSERSWAEAAERISRGQVRTAYKLQFLCLITAIVSLCQTVILKRSRRGCLLVSVTSL